jgi:hypothetical protein
MACFLVPVSEAIVLTVVQKVAERRSKSTGGERSEKGMSPWVRRLGWLNTMLWGGGVLLAFEHLWHGEIVPWFPFLTAMENPADVGPMLHEIATVGATMAIAVTAVWAVMVLVVGLREKSLSATGGEQ